MNISSLYLLWRWCRTLSVGCFTLLRMLLQEMRALRELFWDISLILTSSANTSQHYRHQRRCRNTRRLLSSIQAARPRAHRQRGEWPNQDARQALSRCIPTLKHFIRHHSRYRYGNVACMDRLRRFVDISALLPNIAYVRYGQYR